MMWSIDVRDWVFGIDGHGDPERKQYEAFKTELESGGDCGGALLYESTVDQFKGMIKVAKTAGRKFVRMDQYVGDPSAPRTWGYKG